MTMAMPIDRWMDYRCGVCQYSTPVLLLLPGQSHRLVDMNWLLGFVKQMFLTLQLLHNKKKKTKKRFEKKLKLERRKWKKYGGGSRRRPKITKSATSASRWAIHSNNQTNRRHRLCNIQFICQAWNVHFLTVSF